MVTFYNINILYFVGFVIYYQVVGRGLAELSSFNGTSIYNLKRAIKEESQLPYPPDVIKLFVGEPNKQKDDLDNLQKAFKTRRGKFFNFSKLLNEYKIDADNPISVEIPSK